MLKGKLIHPELIHQLALCGHGSKILIADGNYPLEEKSSGVKIFLGLGPGVPSVIEVLAAIHSVCEIEKAQVMVPEDDREPEIFGEFRRELPDLELEELVRYDFYAACMGRGSFEACGLHRGTAHICKYFAHWSAVWNKK